jgi:uncharacterized membrane protein
MSGGRDRVDLVISTLLRVGVAASTLLVLVGVVLMFLQHPGWSSDEATLRALLDSSAAAPTLAEIGRGIVALEGESIILLGLSVLIATPIMRVAVSIVAFVIERDWIFVAITSLVLSLLLTAVALSRALD